VNNIISTFDITKEALPDLLLKIRQGKIQIPDLQRSFCWSDDLVIQLLASVSLGWPVGSILLLETNINTSFRPRLVEGVILKQPPLPAQLILDGQQRTTTLFMTLFSENPTLIRDKRSQKISERWYYIDIRKALDPAVERETTIISFSKTRIKPGFGEGATINCSTPDREYELLLFPVNSVFNYADWRQQYSRYWNYNPTKLSIIDRFEKEVIKRFEHYQIPVILLKPELPKPAICRVFEKTNTQGTELNFFDLATACFASDDFSLREDWEIREKQLKKFRVLSSVREIDFLSCVTLVATYHRRQKALKLVHPPQKLPIVACGRGEVLSLTVEEYQTFVDQVIGGYEEAARFLHGQRIVAAEDIPYQIQLVALAAVLAIIGFPQGKVRSRLEQWFWCGACASMYTSWHEVRAARDMLEVPEWLLRDGSLPSTINDAIFNSSRLFGVQRRYGSVYKSVSALLRRHGAIDLATGETLSDVNYFNDPIESHHIFPTAYCKRLGIASSHYNCLVNRTPLSRLSNQKIGGRAPSQYLKAFESQGISRQRIDAMLRSHLIEPETLWSDDFDAFISTRSQGLLELISQAMGQKSNVGSLIDIRNRQVQADGKVVRISSG